jgi:PleD family two-component response regulator
MKVDSTYEIKCTLRCGMIPKLDKSIDDLLKEVDAALYEAQQTGRNKRVMHAARR